MAHTQSTAAEIGHDVHPAHRQFHPVAVASDLTFDVVARGLLDGDTGHSLADSSLACAPDQAKSR
jgi:hypothetical protein